MRVYRHTVIVARMLDSITKFEMMLLCEARVFIGNCLCNLNHLLNHDNVHEVNVIEINNAV